MAVWTITHAQLPGAEGQYALEFDHESRLVGLHPMTSAIAASQEVDVQGDWISPGGIDLQINGALGIAFPEIQPNQGEALEKICDWLWHQGIDGFCPTMVTTSIAQIHTALQAIAQWMQHQADHPRATAQVLGAHLEGPFLHPQKRGAHPAEHLQPLTGEMVQQVLGDWAETVKILTLAPELDSTGTVIPALRQLGITVSLGHSQAIAAEAQQAFDLGATMVTHAFNAMPGLHHREPGLLGTALCHPQVMSGVIADGVHVCPTMLDGLMRWGRGQMPPPPYPQGLFLVSDALAPLGLPDGVYPWDDRQMEVRQGTARLADGTLAGTTLPLLTGVQNLVTWGICSVAEAIALATLAPRRAIGLPPFALGEKFSPIRWHWNHTERSLSWQRLVPPG